MGCRNHPVRILSILFGFFLILYFGATGCSSNGGALSDPITFNASLLADCEGATQVCPYDCTTVVYSQNDPEATNQTNVFSTEQVPCDDNGAPCSFEWTPLSGAIFQTDDILTASVTCSPSDSILSTFLGSKFLKEQDLSDYLGILDYLDDFIRYVTFDCNGNFNPALNPGVVNLNCYLFDSSEIANKCTLIGTFITGLNIFCAGVKKTETCRDLIDLAEELLERFPECAMVPALTTTCGDGRIDIDAGEECDFDLSGEDPVIAEGSYCTGLECIAPPWDGACTCTGNGTGEGDGYCNTMSELLGQSENGDCPVCEEDYYTCHGAISRGTISPDLDCDGTGDDCCAGLGEVLEFSSTLTCDESIPPAGGGGCCVPVGDDDDDAVCGDNALVTDANEFCEFDFSNLPPDISVDPSTCADGTIDDCIMPSFDNACTCSGDGDGFCNTFSEVVGLNVNGDCPTCPNLPDINMPYSCSYVIVAAYLDPVFDCDGTGDGCCAALGEELEPVQTLICDENFGGGGCCVPATE